MSAKLAYRNALKAINIAFKNDQPMLGAAKQQIRSGIMSNAQLTKPDEVAEAVKKLDEVSKFIRHNLVQGKLQEDGRYFLDFHKEIELGDNETIKNSKAEMGSLSGAKGKSIRVAKCS